MHAFLFRSSDTFRTVRRRAFFLLPLVLAGLAFFLLGVVALHGVGVP
jgi:hypothetical protein